MVKTTTLHTVYQISDICDFLKRSGRTTVSVIVETMYNKAPNAKFESMDFVKKLFALQYGSGAKECLNEFTHQYPASKITAGDYQKQFNNIK